MKRLLIFFLMIVTLSLMAACGGAAQPETAPDVETVVEEAEVVENAEVEEVVEAEAPTGPKETVIFQNGTWQTHWINTAIAAYITEYGYGYPVELIDATTEVMQPALPIGDLHVNMELWRVNIQDWYDENVANGSIVDVGAVFESTGQGWYIPRYTAEEHDIWSVEDLKDPTIAQLFQDPEDPDKGVWVNCIVGWGCQKVMRVKATSYGLDEYYNVIEPGTSAGLDAAIASAYERGEPILSYYWEPTWILGKYDMVRLEEPEWTPECWEQIVEASEQEPFGTVEEACDYQSFDIRTGIWSGLVDQAPDVVEMLSNMFVGTARINELSAYMEDNDATAEETAIYYLQTYEDDWTQWVTEEAAENVRAQLAEE